MGTVDLEARKIRFESMCVAFPDEIVVGVKDRVTQGWLVEANSLKLSYL